MYVVEGFTPSLPELLPKAGIKGTTEKWVLSSTSKPHPVLTDTLLLKGEEKAHQRCAGVRCYTNKKRAA